MSTEVNYNRVLSYLMKSWALCFGTLTVLAVIGWWVPHLWMPVAAFLLLIAMQAYSRRNIAVGAPYCPLFVLSTTYSLIVALVIMIGINLINSRWFIDTNLGKFAHPDLPFISTLVVYPSMIIGYGYALFFRGETNLCNACRERAGYSLKDTLERNVFHHEVKFQIRLSFTLGVVMAIVSWVYYFIFYINVNINTPDTFFFFIIPAALYGISLAYFFFKYASLDFEIRMVPGTVDSKFHTLVRFMVIKGDCMMLKEIEVEDKHLGLWETPASYKMPFVSEVDTDQAKEIFETLAETDRFSLRPLFVTNTDKHNCFHFAAFLDADTETVLHGEWFTLLDVDLMLKAGRLTRPTAYEIHRVYTMTMAWKTYDREGRRLYAIRNYRPTFKLVDFKNWDLDYSDVHWLAVAQNNEDKHFFKLRRLWRRYVSGTDKLWRRRNS